LLTSDVDPADQGEDLRGDAVHGGPVADVAHVGRRRCPEAADLVGDPVDAFTVDVPQGEVCSSPARRLERHEPADAGSGARDQDRGALQHRHGGTIPSSEETPGGVGVAAFDPNPTTNLPSL
jgi:hypothetical protein